MMKYDVFTRLESAVEDYRLSSIGAKAAERDARELAKALADRKRAERERNKSRREELDRKISDPATTATVRRMLQGELSELEAADYALTEEEALAFNEAIEELRQTVKDTRAAYEAAKDALREARAALEEIRSTVNGTADLDLLGRSPDVLGADFKRMLAAAQGKTA